MGFNAHNAHETIIDNDLATSIPSSTESSVHIFTNTIAKGFFFVDEIIATGQVPACFNIYHNATLKVQYKTSEQLRTMSLKFPASWQLQRTDFIEIKVVHDYDMQVADFRTTIIGHRVN